MPPKAASTVVKRKKTKRTTRSTEVNESTEFNEYDDEDDSQDLKDAFGTEYIVGEFAMNRLQASNFVKRKLKTIWDMMKKESIDLNPEYQRDVVWDDGRQSQLVKSLLQGFYVPPVILSVKEDEFGMKIYTCVDGKQRISSIVKFMDGLIPVEDKNKKKWWFKSNGNQKRCTLPEEVKDLFRELPLICYEYTNLERRVEEQMFQLVQRGLPLTPAEKLRAEPGPWGVLMRDYETRYAKILNLTNTKRAAGFRLMLTICAQIMENEQSNAVQAASNRPPPLQNSPQTLGKILLRREFLTDDLKAIFERVLDRFLALLETCLDDGGVPEKNTVFDGYLSEFHARGLWKPVRTFSPLEILATAILIHHYKGRTDTMLMGDLLELRVFLRSKHADLRINGNCWANAWKFIHNILPGMRGLDDETVPKAKRIRVNDAANHRLEEEARKNAEKKKAKAQKAAEESMFVEQEESGSDDSGDAEDSEPEPVVRPKQAAIRSRPAPVQARPTQARPTIQARSPRTEARANHRFANSDDEFGADLKPDVSRLSLENDVFVQPRKRIADSDGSDPNAKRRQF